MNTQDLKNLKVCSWCGYATKIRKWTETDKGFKCPICNHDDETKTDRY